MIRAAIICGMLAIGLPAQAAVPDTQTAEEINLLEVLDARHAAAACHFSFDDARAADILSVTGLTMKDVDSKPRSASLQKDADDMSDAYRTDLQSACAQAWKTYGDGGEYSNHLLRR